MVLKLAAVTLPDASMINTMSARRLVQSVAALEKEEEKKAFCQVSGLCDNICTLECVT